MSNSQMTAEQRLAYLLEEVEKINKEPVTLLVLEKSLTVEEYNNVLVSLHFGQMPQAETPTAIAEATRIRGLFSALSVGGLDLWQDYHQEQLASIGGKFGWPNELTQKIQRISRPLRPRWQIEGYNAEPTLEQIEAEIDTEAVRVWWVAHRAVVEDRLHKGEITTQQQVLNILGAE